MFSDYISYIYAVLIQGIVSFVSIPFHAQCCKVMYKWSTSTKMQQIYPISSKKIIFDNFHLFLKCIFILKRQFLQAITQFFPPIGVFSFPGFFGREVESPLKCSFTHWDPRFVVCVGIFLKFILSSRRSGFTYLQVSYDLERKNHPRVLSLLSQWLNINAPEIEWFLWGARCCNCNLNITIYTNYWELT